MLAVGTYQVMLVFESIESENLTIGLVTAGNYSNPKTFTVANANAVENIDSENSIKIFPNPVTSGKLKIENSQLKAGDIIPIYDVAGKLIINCQLSTV
ncbi:MAG: hypothetical protein LBN23_08480, partial [Paludibacter sp.]|nr:hypothetical protein [Paludibacter sp.]